MFPAQLQGRLIVIAVVEHGIIIVIVLGEDPNLLRSRTFPICVSRK
jgi:hypothetical protein